MIAAEEMGRTCYALEQSPQFVDVAVVRRHPERGMVAPNDFIPLAEETHLILPIGVWVLEEACRQLAQWRDAGFAEARVAVNLAAEQLADEGLVDVVKDALSRHAIECGRLEVEITERTAIADEPTTARALEQLHSLGVRITLDDFGTGYSSALLLVQYPFDTLKIDRSFVTRVANGVKERMVTAAIIEPAHAAGMTVVAEGVKTREQLYLMHELGSDEVPPYIRINRLVDCYPREVRFIQSTYASAAFGKVDIYVAFLERGLALLSGRGRMGFIVPNKFVQSEYGRGIRQILSHAGALETLIDFGHGQVFDGATSYTCLVFLGSGGGETFSAAVNERAERPQDFLQSAQLETLPQTRLGSAPWSVRGAAQAALIDKLEQQGRPLGELAELAITGVKTGLNRVYAFDLVEERKGTVIVRGEGSDSAVELERDYLRPYCKAESKKRYAFFPRERLLLYPYRLAGESTSLVPEAELRDACPLTWAHLLSHKRELERRESGKLAGESWYGLSFASDLRMFRGPKLVTPTLAPLNSFALDDSGCAFPQGAGGGCGIVPKSSPGLGYLLAVLNSKLLTYYFQRISSCFQGGWYAYEPRYLRRIPICAVTDGDNVAGQLEQAAVELTRLSVELPAAQTPPFAAEARKREQMWWENQVDTLVYQLFGLTDDEIGMVQASLHRG